MSTPSLPFDIIQIMRAKLQKSYEKCKINDNFISFQGVTVRLIKPKKEYKFHKNIKILFGYVRCFALKKQKAHAEKVLREQIILNILIF